MPVGEANRNIGLQEGQTMPMNQEPKTLRPFIEAMQVGDPLGHLNLTLVPLRGERRGQLDYLLSMDALTAGTLTITEVSEGGSVPELLAVNQGQQMLLLLDGEELVGAKQNRILNTTLPAQSKTRIPVSCVEQGRWRHVSHEFAPGSYSPAKLRARKSRDVSRNLATVGEARSDQGGVWEEVAANMCAAAVPSPTMAMHDVVDQRRDSLTGFIEAMRYPAEARGIMAAIGGHFVVMDLFDKPATLERIWARLVTGYAMDAIVWNREADKGKQFTAKGATALLEHVGEVECRAFPSVGLGQDWRFEAPDVLGQALVAEGESVHLCVFPNDIGGQRQDAGSSILPPSTRRRMRPNRG